MRIQGSCHCRRITYEAEVDPAAATICHCTDCQTLSGSSYRAAVPAASKSFRLLSGEPKRYVKTADSGARRLHAFCGDCGAPVYSCAESNPTSYSLRIGCLAQRSEIAPKMQIWFRSATPWAQDIRDVPKIDRQ